MKQYAVAILSFFDNDNKIFLQHAENEVEAIKEALINFTKEEYKEEQREYNKTFPEDYKIMLDMLIDQEMSVAIIEISQ